jgi:hypothetical protein
MVALGDKLSPSSAVDLASEVTTFSRRQRLV